MISVGDYSTELCGGTHVDQSSDIHLFKIGSESGIAAGVRRIIAYTSKGAFDFLRAQDNRIKSVRDQIKASSFDEIPNKIEKIFEETRELKKQIEKFESAGQGTEIEELFAKSEMVNDVRVIAGQVQKTSDGMKKLREMADKIKQKDPSAVAVLGIQEVNDAGTKPFLVVAVGAKVKNVNAGEVIKASADKFGGKGGGKPDFAQAGGSNVAGTDDAIAAAKAFVVQKIKA